mmetsp:Transcript_9779/g.14137  ORF Transcript_9779/g.14137 Transcript_9779/m.14137 type:complete len:135 (-) Transcript_9779:2912-3316(-)
MDITTRKIQMFMGVVFTGMGLATVAFPATVANLSFTNAFLGKEGVTPALQLVMQCFGSQASLCGLLILSSDFRIGTFRNFGLAMIPYFIFDYHFWKTGALTLFGASGDAVGNSIFSFCCYIGYNRLNGRNRKVS